MLSSLKSFSPFSTPPEKLPTTKDLARRALNFSSDGRCLPAAGPVREAIIKIINEGKDTETLTIIFNNALHYQYQDKLSELIQKECVGFHPSKNLQDDLLKADIRLSEDSDGAFSITWSTPASTTDEQEEWTKSVCTMLQSVSIPKGPDKIICEKAETTQKEKIGAFLGIGRSIFRFTDAQISAMLIKKFDDINAPGFTSSLRKLMGSKPAQLELNGFEFTVPRHRARAIVTVPACVTLINCKLANGEMEFSAGQLTATKERATVHATGPAATAVAKVKGSWAIAKGGGKAIADGEHTKAIAYGQESIAIAQVASSIADAREEATALAQADGAKANAYGIYSIAEAMVAGSEADATDSATAIAHTTRATASASNYSTAIAHNGAKAFAHKDSVARAYGSSSAYARNPSATAESYGHGMAYAQRYGAVAKAFDRGTAHATGFGAVAEKHSKDAQVFETGGITKDKSS